MIIPAAISPCPNDTFIFDALINQRISNDKYQFAFQFLDIEQLNSLAIANTKGLLKISYHAFLKVHQHYKLLKSGSAMGFGTGPLLVAKKPMDINAVNKAVIAIPGFNTTANFLLSYTFPEAVNRKTFCFSDIETAILDNQVDAGVIIHESRFTYKEKGLTCIADLGKLWDEAEKTPLPLGGIVMHRSYGDEAITKVESLVRESAAYAMKNPDVSAGFIKKYAAEMDTETINKHIRTYVNDFSLDMGEEGKKAVVNFFRAAGKLNLCNPSTFDIFA